MHTEFFLAATFQGPYLSARVWTPLWRTQYLGMMVSALNFEFWQPSDTTPQYLLGTPVKPKRQKCAWTV